MRISWVIITGEYPPKIGGVSDYTYQLAQALVRCGDEVHVLAPPCHKPYGASPGVSLHEVPDHFGIAGLAHASKLLSRIRPDRVLVQYVPHGYGMKAMNLPFSVWVSRRTEPLDVMFHEVVYPRIKGQPWRHVVLARATAWMARRIARRADRIFVSSLSWVALLNSVAGTTAPAVWTPVPTNVATDVPAELVASARDKYAATATRLVGHFGTYGHLMTSVMENALVRLLDPDPSVHALMIGRGSDLYVRDLLHRLPHLLGRIHGTGALASDAVAARLLACDLLLQPYIDGICTRRSTTMAGLALGVPVVTNRGISTEPLWLEGNAIALAVDSNADGLASLASEILSDDVRRSKIGRAGRGLYRRLFDLSHTVEALRDFDARPTVFEPTAM